MTDYNTQNPYNLKPAKGLKEWAAKQFESHYIWYRRKGRWSECHCSECDARYVTKIIEEDPFEDAQLIIDKPERDKKTECPRCGTDALYKPAGHTKSEWNYNRVCYGQKINNETFAFRVFFCKQIVSADCKTRYYADEEKRIILHKGKKPERFSSNDVYWYKSNVGEGWFYLVHPQTFKEIKKTAMFKYVPVEENIVKRWGGEDWVIKYYTAAARYPDFEMMIKVGLTEYADRLVCGYPTNINPRGRKIEDRLRIYKSRIPYIIKERGSYGALTMFQLEKKRGWHWTDEELEYFNVLKRHSWNDKWMIALEYTTLTKLHNYFVKQKIWPKAGENWERGRRKHEIMTEYFDYLQMRIDSGYDLTNDIFLFPKDLARRHDEMVAEREQERIDKRRKEVTRKFPRIAKRYKELDEKYSATAGGYIIRPAKDANEIVTEGRELHHCAGGDNYLSSHNQGKSFILFLRPVKKKDKPYITVEIKDNEVKQWYGAYDKKPQKKLFDAWLEAYCEELKKRAEKPAKKRKCTKTA